MYTIALRNLEFFAYHGFYPEEQILGNHYHLDIIVSVNEERYRKDDIRTTINYEELFHVASGVMKDSVKLLETVVLKIHSEIIRKYSYVDSIEVILTKHNPMIEGMIGDSVVSLVKNYNG